MQLISKIAISRTRGGRTEFCCTAVVIAKRGIKKLLSGDPLTKTHKTTRIFRKLGPERSEVTPGEIGVSRLGPTASTQRSMSQESFGGNPETPASA